MTLTRIHIIGIAAVIAVLAAAGVLYEMRGGAVHAPSAPPAALAPFAATRAPAPVPQVAILNGTGTRVSLTQFKGKYVLLNLWATWCGPCVGELPALAKLKTADGGRNFEVVAVDVGRGTAADARKFLDANHAKSLDTYVDSNLALLRAFGAFGLPLTILIDPQGREIGRAVGPAHWDDPEAIAYFKALAQASS